mmetsp:Transcript_24683/g.45373  ORF Transcript_24683/g.45373 Transcript_24683/m.45373 type:complete len:209 (-) Transcript_24683:188-814(-)
MVNVLGFDTHLPTRGRGEQTAKFGDDRTIKGAEHGFVALPQISIHHQHINSRTQSINRLDFQHGTLQIRTPHQLLPQFPLGDLTQQHQYILYSLPGNSRSGNQRNKVGIRPIVVPHLPVNIGVDAQFLQLDFGLARPRSKFLDGAVRLFLQSIADGGVLTCLPVVTSIDFVEGDDEGGALIAEHLQTFNGLLFQSVHQIDDQYRHVAQ